MLKHSTCNGDVNGKVNAVLCNAVKLLLLWCLLGNKFREFFESFLYRKIASKYDAIFLYKILDCVSPALI